jgi:hypothetical protein
MHRLGVFKRLRHKTSFAPSGSHAGHCLPTACAVGYILAPLRGFLRPRTAMTISVRPTFVPVDAHNLPVLMCNYTGKEVVG